MLAIRVLEWAAISAFAELIPGIKNQSPSVANAVLTLGNRPASRFNRRRMAEPARPFLMKDLI
jgi:hypothetical protein